MHTKQTIFLRWLLAVLINGFFIKISLSDGLANLSDLVYTGLQ